MVRQGVSRPLETGFVVEIAGITGEGAALTIDPTSSIVNRRLTMSRCHGKQSPISTV